MAGGPIASGKGLLRPDWREAGRWSLAGIVVVGVHAGAVWAINKYQPEDRGGDIAAAVMIDMEPLPAPVVAQPVKEEVPVEPEPVNPEPVQQEAAAPEPAEQVQPEPEQQIQPLEEGTPDHPEPDLAEEVTPEPEEAEAVDEQAEELVELPKVEAPLPVVRPQARKPDTPKKSIVEQSVRKPVKKTETAVVKDETPREARRQPTASSAGSARQAEKWRSRVEAYLARHARRARTRGEGTVSVRFVVTRDGKIVSSSIVGSSGSSQLDQSVLETVRRASPVPSAPDEVAVSRQSFTVPFQIR
jgi:protein TonB